MISATPNRSVLDHGREAAARVPTNLTQETTLTQEQGISSQDSRVLYNRWQLPTTESVSQPVTHNTSTSVLERSLDRFSNRPPRNNLPDLASDIYEVSSGENDDIEIINSDSNGRRRNKRARTSESTSSATTDTNNETPSTAKHLGRDVRSHE